MRVPFTAGHETKNTAFVKDPETLCILTPSDVISGFDQDDTLSVLTVSSRLDAKAPVLYFLS